MATNSNYISMDIKGYIKNYVNIPKDKGLLPVFEAIINSIHAIEEGEVAKGKVIIEIIRQEKNAKQTSFNGKSGESINPIRSFFIKDNGIGFNQANYDSFKLACTRRKAKMGGKGVGRFFWLKAFEEVIISSVYQEDIKKGKKQREFYFLPEENFLQKDNITKPNAKEPFGTSVHLKDFHSSYLKTHSIPLEKESIADKIIEHSLIYFLSNTCPSIEVQEGAEKIELNQRFQDTIIPCSHKKSFQLKGEKFQLDCLRLYSSKKQDHNIHLCANYRQVKSEPLKTFIPDIKIHPLVDENGKKYSLQIYVSSPFLDSSVNAERTGFHLVDHSEMNSDQLEIEQDIVKISEEAIFLEVKKIAEQLVKPDLDRVREEKIKTIEQFIEEENPRYRSLLKLKPERLKEIPADLSNENLDIALHIAYQELELETKKEGAEILNAPLSARNDPDYEKKYSKHLEKIKEVGRDKLAEYIIHRKAVLGILEDSLKIGDDGKASYENRVHRILHPPQNLSDDIDFMDQNLWIIDEKLSYHQFLSSDVKLSKVGSNLSDSRPDILIFNKPTAFSEGEEPYNTVVILELKRPEKKEYKENENPIQQTLNYAKELKSGKKLDRYRNLLTVDDKSRFYCYILVSLTEKMHNFSQLANLHPTPDNWGYYGYNLPFNAYIEVIDYRKLLIDAKKRNRVLFDKLGLPH